MTAAGSAVNPEAARSVGRPRRVTRSMIAHAAYEVGLQDLTMRAVADRLGVSTTSLYYHVRDRDDLMRLVADYSAAQLVLPQDSGQHWTCWLYEWADYARLAFAGQPGLLEQFLNGTIPVEKMLPNIDLVIAVMEREGFSPDDAMRAYLLVSNVAIGAAVAELRGDPATTESVKAATSAGSGRFEHLERVSLAYEGGGAADSFFDQILTVLIGIAVRCGEDPSVVTSHLTKDLSGPKVPRQHSEVGIFHP
jgi:AcrR family transcriptional regulator